MQGLSLHAPAGHRGLPPARRPGDLEAARVWVNSVKGGQPTHQRGAHDPHLPARAKFRYPCGRDHLCTENRTATSWLFQQSQQLAPGFGFTLFAMDPVRAGISRFKAGLHNRQVFVLRQRSVLIRIAGRKILLG
jgi:hypothetical protein